MENITKWMKEAKEDPELFSKIDINAILSDLKHKQFIKEGQTIELIAEEVRVSLLSEPVLNTYLTEYSKKLADYRFIDELHNLHRGKYLRWIRKSTGQLMRGGIFVDIKFGNEGANILCRTTTGKFTQFRFDLCLTYQKLTDDEQLLLHTGKWR
jgi:hypothetical protein